MSDADFVAVMEMGPQELAEMYAEYQHMKTSHTGKKFKEQEKEIQQLRNRCDAMNKAILNNMPKRAEDIYYAIYDDLVSSGLAPKVE